MIRKLLLVVTVLAATTTATQAMPNMPGLKIYWNSMDCTTTYKLTQIRLYQITLDGHYNIASRSNFDNLPSPVLNQYGTSSGNFFGYQDVEVWDPRASGGTGKLLVADVYDDYPPSRGYSNLTGVNNFNQPWDVLVVDPFDCNVTSATYSIAQGNMLTSGRLFSTGWNSCHVTAALTAPPNWRGVNDHGTGLILMGHTSQNGVISHVWDADGVNKIDNTTNEGLNIGSVGGQYDSEVAMGEKTLYYSDGTNVKRVYGTATGGVTQTYLTLASKGSSPPWLKGGNGMGIAIKDMGAAAPIVYVIAEDNTNGSGGTSSTIKEAIWAFRDTNGDNVITPGVDTGVRVWKDGDFGLSIKSRIYGEDVEYTTYHDENGTHQLLFFNTYYNGIYALSLADNGLLATDGKNIVPDGNGLYSLGPSLDRSGFEIDINAVAGVPEPTTMTLVCTGALAAVAWLRRRRVK